MHQASVICRVLIGAFGRKPQQLGRTFGTTTRELEVLRAWLIEHGVTRVGMELTRAPQAKLRRARGQLLIFMDWPGQVTVTNNGCERDFKAAVIQRRVTSGCPAMWAAQSEVDVRTVIDTSRLTPSASVFATILHTVAT